MSKNQQITDDIAAADSYIRTLIDFIRSLEWSGTVIAGSGYAQYACPSCKQTMQKGHAKNCKLAKLIK